MISWFFFHSIVRFPAKECLSLFKFDLALVFQVTMFVGHGPQPVQSGGLRELQCAATSH